MKCVFGIIIIIINIYVQLIHCNVIYVSIEIGIDNQECGSTTNPCQSIQYGINQAISGDTVMVSPGLYNNQSDFNLLLSGKNLTIM